MARPKNKIDTVPVQVRTTPQVAGYLDQLLAIGLYGKSRAEAAEAVISRWIEQAIKEGYLPRADSKRRGTARSSGGKRP